MAVNIRNNVYTYEEKILNYNGKAQNVTFSVSNFNAVIFNGNNVTNTIDIGNPVLYAWSETNFSILAESNVFKGTGSGIFVDTSYSFPSG